MDKNYLLAFKKNIINLKKILVITYYWPPSGGPGVQRVLKYCKYLPKYGWEPIILTVSGGDFPVLDESLKSEVKNLKIFRSKPLSLHKVFNSLIGKKNTPTFQLSSSDKDSLFIKFARWIRLNLIIPDGRVGWYPGAVREGNKIINQQKIDVIFTILLYKEFTIFYWFIFISRIRKTTYFVQKMNVVPVPSFVFSIF